MGRRPARWWAWESNRYVAFWYSKSAQCLFRHKPGAEMQLHQWFEKIILKKGTAKLRNGFRVRCQSSMADFLNKPCHIPSFEYQTCHFIAYCPLIRCSNHYHHNFAVIDTVRTSRTQSRVSAVVCQTQRFASLTWAARRLSSKIFHCASISCPMNMNSWARRHWKPVAFAATNTWSSSAARISSTSECVSIHSTLFASTRCCRALELIGEFFTT